MKNNTCYKCKSDNLSIIKRENNYKVKGYDKVTITERVLKCNNCGEILFDEELEREKLNKIYRECGLR